MPGQYLTAKALLSATPPRAVRLDLPSDNLEESALRGTTVGTLASSISWLEGRISPHKAMLAAGRLPAGNAFSGCDADLSKLKALKQIACMIKKHGSINPSRLPRPLLTHWWPLERSSETTQAHTCTTCAS